MSLAPLRWGRFRFSQSSISRCSTGNYLTGYTGRNISIRLQNPDAIMGEKATTYASRLLSWFYHHRVTVWFLAVLTRRILTSTLHPCVSTILLSVLQKTTYTHTPEADPGGGGGAEWAIAPPPPPPPPPFPLEHAPFYFVPRPFRLPKCLDLRTCENESTRDVRKEVPINAMRYS